MDLVLPAEADVAEWFGAEREKMGNIKQRRQLTELFKQGVEIRFGPGPDGKPLGKIGPFVNDHGARIAPKGDEVAMFVRPPDPVQRDMAIRAAQGRRAAALVRAKRDEESEEHLTILAFLSDMSDETLIEYVVAADTNLRRQEAEREVLALDEWKDMTSYQEAMSHFASLEEHELEENDEYEALLDLDEKYGKQITAREIELTDAQREALGFLQRDQVERKALEKRAEIVGSQAFMAEYEKQMLFYSVRDHDKTHELFFENANELASQPDEVRELINEAIMPFISETGEAKNSQRAADGSSSSALPDAPETSDSSTPEAATA